MFLRPQRIRRGQVRRRRKDDRRYQQSDGRAKKCVESAEVIRRYTTSAFVISVPRRINLSALPCRNPRAQPPLAAASDAHHRPGSCAQGTACRRRNHTHRGDCYRRSPMDDPDGFRRPNPYRRKPHIALSLMVALSLPRQKPTVIFGPDFKFLDRLSQRTCFIWRVDDSHERGR